MLARDWAICKAEDSGVTEYFFVEEIEFPRER